MPDESEKATPPDRSVVEISDLLGLREFAVELVRATRVGLGHGFGPWLRRRQAKASVDILSLSKEAVSSWDDVPVSMEALLDLDGRVRLHVSKELRRQQRNREPVAIEAIEEWRGGVSEEGKEGKGATGARLTDEWIDRFWRLAQDVSNADLQRLWGRVLAREARRPGSVALQTLDILSRLDREAAEELQRLGGCTSSATTRRGSRSVILQSFHADSLAGDRRPDSVDAVESRLERIVGDDVWERFGALGLLGLSRWTRAIFVLAAGVDFSAAREADEPRFELAGAPFRLRGLPPPRDPSRKDEVHLGEGLGWTRPGREIPSLARVAPDPDHLASLREGFEHLGLTLEGPLPRR
ncbi:MAG: hypothetical protein KatS3mg117_3300 [Geminicoccaceae bacterium]|jgi:hypothetical protein|nr:MAG: hypothetical protein KatS3mg117_3300 [Geminicoccaceae bacterium]